MNRIRTILLAGLLFASAACRQGTGQLSPMPAGPEVVVYVANHFETALTISAEGSGTVQRLGVVGPNTTRSFVVPQVLIASGGSVMFSAQPAGAPRAISADPILLRPGQIADFEIATNLVGSRATVRP